MQKKLIGTTALALLLSIAPFKAQASMRAEDDRKVMTKTSKSVLTAHEEAKNMLTSTEYLLKSFEEAPVVVINNGGNGQQAANNLDQGDLDLIQDLFADLADPNAVVAPLVALGNPDDQGGQAQGNGDVALVGQDVNPAPAAKKVAANAKQGAHVYGNAKKNKKNK